jgi:hypothetical protein
MAAALARRLPTADVGAVPAAALAVPAPGRKAWHLGRQGITGHSKTMGPVVRLQLPPSQGRLEWGSPLEAPAPCQAGQPTNGRCAAHCLNREHNIKLYDGVFVCQPLPTRRLMPITSS